MDWFTLYQAIVVLSQQQSPKSIGAIPLHYQIRWHHYEDPRCGIKKGTLGVSRPPPKASYSPSSSPAHCLEARHEIQAEQRLSIAHVMSKQLV